MWFDVQQALNEIEGGTLPLSVKLKAAVPAQRARVAVVASVAAPPAQKPQIATGPTDLQTHGVTCGGRPKTWMGRVVSLAAWRDLTEWERDGPQGRHWNGITKQWKHPKGNADDI
jgi:hypothetical protein